MSSHDPQRQFALEVVERLRGAGYEAYWAGGCVRDFLVGRQPKDYDVATDARPEKVREIFGHRRTVAVGASFGVVLVRGPKEAGDVEVATFRTEGPYADGRRPDHVSFTTAEYDARRRDFTINGMFYDPIGGKVIDYVGGEQDLKDKIVRAIGDPRDRMREDKLRMLRTVRFAATMNFSLDENTADAVREMSAEILLVSAERIAQELKRMLVDKNRKWAIMLCVELGLLPQILPELRILFENAPYEITSEWQRTLRMLVWLDQPSFELAAAVLLQGVPDDASDPPGQVARNVCKRLRLSNDETDRITWLIVHQHDLDNAPNLSPAQLKRRLAAPWIDELLSLMLAGIRADEGDLTSVTFCEDYLRNTPRDQINPPPLLSGDDLVEMGMSPGPQFKDILDTVRDAQLNGEIQSANDARELARKLQ